MKEIGDCSYCLKKSMDLLSGKILEVVGFTNNQSYNLYSICCNIIYNNKMWLLL